MKKILLFLILLVVSAQAQKYPYPYPTGTKVKVQCRDIHPLTWQCIYDSVSANLDSTRFATIDTVIVIVRDSIVAIYPIPIDSLVDSTFTVIADSGVGGGGTANLGDTLYIRNHVDSVTIDIFKDTLRVDTTKIATHKWASDTALQIASDSSQYYYWRAKSQYHFPQWENMVPWNLNDFRTAQDSVDICYFVEAATYWPYMQIEKDAAATDSQYVFPHFSFVAPRDVSDITDTLFAVRYKTTSADTLNVGIKLMVYEGTTARYVATDISASTSWDTLIVLKSYGTMTSIVAGDEFYLIPYCKVDGDSLWIGRIEERWY